MAVDWDLPRRMEETRLQELQVLGAERSRDVQNRTALDRLREIGEQRQARPQIQQQVAAGDYRGAQAAAVGVGDTGLAETIGRLSEDARKELAGQNELYGRAAYALKRMPEASRPTAWAAMAPRFRAAGMHDEELTHINDFSDGALDGHIAMSQSIRDNLASDLTQARIDDVGADNERADRLAGNTIRNTDDMIHDRHERRALTKRGQDLADDRGRYSVGVASRDRQRGQNLAHEDRVRAREQPRVGRGRGGAPTNPASMIPGASAELPVTVTTVAQAKMLSRGTFFRTPQGKIMRVP